MINYTISEFLGIFLIGFPVFVFFTILIFRGLYWLVEDYIVEPDRFFLFHYHYRDKRNYRDRDRRRR